MGPLCDSADSARAPQIEFTTLWPRPGGGTSCLQQIAELAVRVKATQTAASDRPALSNPEAAGRRPRWGRELPACPDSSPRHTQRDLTRAGRATCSGEGTSEGHSGAGRPVQRPLCRPPPRGTPRVSCSCKVTCSMNGLQLPRKFFIFHGEMIDGSVSIKLQRMKMQKRTRHTSPEPLAEPPGSLPATPGRAGTNPEKHRATQWPSRGGGSSGLPALCWAEWGGESPC